MAELSGAPVGFGNRVLFPGDRVIYTSRSRLFQGILIKTNPHKSLVQETNKDWEPRTVGWRFQIIDNSKIFKLNE